MWADTGLKRDVNLAGVPDRPPQGKGTNYLVVGSDSRQGLTSRAKKDLHTGTAEGRRTDSMIRDAVGGVDMCLDRDIKDKNSGVNLKKGCQNLDGAEALAFVRQRHQETQGDLGRTRNQQKLLTALARKAATPSTLLNPSTVYPALGSGLNTLVVDEDTGLPDLTALFRAVKGVTSGKGKRVDIPVADPNFSTTKGSAVLWHKAQAQKLFNQLRDDRPVTFEAKH